MNKETGEEWSHGEVTALETVRRVRRYIFYISKKGGKRSWRAGKGAKSAESAEKCKMERRVFQCSTGCAPYRSSPYGNLCCTVFASVRRRHTAPFSSRCKRELHRTLWIQSGKVPKRTPPHLLAWNSYHIVSNALLLNLPIHSIHHLVPKRPFPLHNAFPIPNSPTMPLPYAISSVLAFVPPLWFKLMHGPLDEAVAMLRLRYGSA